jgi:hypothetical protein
MLGHLLALVQDLVQHQVLVQMRVQVQVQVRGLVPDQVQLPVAPEVCKGTIDAD